MTIVSEQYQTRRFRAEQAVLGGLLMDNSKFTEVQALISETDFIQPKHQAIFSAIKKQLQNDQPADVVTIAEQGMDVVYIGELFKNTPTAVNTSSYAKIIKEEIDRKTAFEIFNDASERIVYGETPENVYQLVLENVEKSILKHNNGGFMFTSIKDMIVKPIDWLISEFIEVNALVDVFGPPESGKSLLAIAWGLSVAAGIPWNGHKTQPGAVFYIAGEGHNGLSRRFSAWGLHNGVKLNELPFYPSQQAAAFYNKQSAISVERAISVIANQSGVNPKLIIIDTLARNFGPGNESSTEDMSLFIDHIDNHLRKKFNCTVLLVHHSGHGAMDRGGSSALKAAVDTEYSLSKNASNIINLNCSKMKDAQHPSPKSLTIESVNLGISDEKGDSAFGAVLVETVYIPPEPKDKPLPENQEKALEILELLYDEHRQNFTGEGKNPDDAKVTEKYWREKLKDAELLKEKWTFKDIKKSLLNRELINIQDGFVFLD